MPALPPGFRRLERDPVELVVDGELWPTLETLPLLEPDGVDQLFAEAESGADGRGATALVALPGTGERLLLRRLRHGGLTGPLFGGAFLGLGRPLHELAVTDTLRRAGAPVPRPVLVVARRLAGPLWAPTVGTLLVPGAVDALAFLTSGPGHERVLGACTALGRAVRAFHDAGGRHGDLHVKNVLVRESEDGTRAWVIDLDRARVTLGLTPGERMTQLMRLFRSLLKRDVLAQVGPRGCARFFSAYCGDDRLLRRALWSRVDRELRKVALHAWHYPESTPPRAGVAKRTSG